MPRGPHQVQGLMKLLITWQRNGPAHAGVDFMPLFVSYKSLKALYILANKGLLIIKKWHFLKQAYNFKNPKTIN
jgi:hypothetical protein